MNQEESRNPVLRVLANLDLYVAVIAMVIMVAVTFVGVIYRYIISDPFTWLEEVQKICLIWIVFSAGGAAFRGGSHIAVEILVDAMPQGLRAAVEWLIRVVVIAVLGFLTIQAVGYVQLFLGNGRLSSVLRIPQWLIYIIAPVGCADMLVSFVIHEVKALWAGRAGQEEG